MQRAPTGRLSHTLNHLLPMAAAAGPVDWIHDTSEEALEPDVRRP